MFEKGQTVEVATNRAGWVPATVVRENAARVRVVLADGNEIAAKRGKVRVPKPTAEPVAAPVRKTRTRKAAPVTDAAAPKRTPRKKKEV